MQPWSITKSSQAKNSKKMRKTLRMVKNIVLNNNLASKKIISPKYKFIYISVPKAASRSLVTALYRKPMIDYGSFEDHNNYSRLLKRNAHYQKYFKFTFVRNPWSRAVSAYLDKIKNPSQDSIRDIISAYPGLKPGMEFGEFIYFLYRKTGRYDILSDRHWISQYRFFMFKKKIDIDFIGKIENFSKDLLSLKQKLNLPDLAAPYLNSRLGWRTEEKKERNPFYYRRYYDNNLKNLLAKRYKKDIELFNYEF